MSRRVCATNAALPVQLVLTEEHWLSLRAIAYEISIIFADLLA